MNAEELATLTELAISNMTTKRLRVIWDSMDYRSEQEIVNAVRNYVTESHTPDDAQDKSMRVVAAFMSIIYQFEQAEVMK